jgi:hypothetical protein
MHCVCARLCHVIHPEGVERLSRSPSFDAVQSSTVPKVFKQHKQDPCTNLDENYTHSTIPSSFTISSVKLPDSSIGLHLYTIPVQQYK